jgi:hypothetical protein
MSFFFRVSEARIGESKAEPLSRYILFRRFNSAQMDKGFSSVEQFGQMSL